MKIYRLSIRYLDYNFGGFFFSEESLFEHLKDAPLSAILHVHKDYVSYYDPEDLQYRYTPCTVRLEQMNSPVWALTSASERAAFPNERDTQGWAPTLFSEAVICVPISKGKIIGLVEKMLIEQRELNPLRDAAIEIGRVDEVLQGYSDDREGSVASFLRPPDISHRIPNPPNDGIRRIDRTISELQNPEQPEGEQSEDLPF